MAENVDPVASERPPQVANESPEDAPEQFRPVVTRREFMAGAGAGLAVGAAVAGGALPQLRSITWSSTLPEL